MSTYSFVDVNASLAGPTGVATFGNGDAVADEGITIDPVEDKNTMQIAGDGEGLHSLHAGRAAHVTVRLLKSSPTNAVLMTMYDTQTTSSALHGKNTITVTHTVSGDISTCSKVAFKKKPSIVYSKDAALMEWTFDAIKADTILGTY